MAEVDIARIKRNVGKMIELGAPETEIDAYVSSEGVTPEQLRGVNTSQPAKKDTGFVSAVSHGMGEVIKGVGKTVNLGSQGSGDTLEKAGDAISPKDYQPASERFLNPTAEDTNLGGYGVNQLPRVVAESAPSLATDLVAAKAGQKVAGGKGALVAGLASFALRNLGGEAGERAQKRSGDANATPTGEDVAYAGVSTAAQAALNQLGISRFLKKTGGGQVGGKGAAAAAFDVAKTIGVEGGTEYGQDVISQVGTSVNTPGGTAVDWHRAGGAGIAGAATGGAMRTPRAIVDTNSARRFSDFDPEASASFTARLDKHAENLGNVKDARRSFLAAEADAKHDLKTALSSDPTVIAAIKSDIDASRAFNRVNGNEALNSADLAAIDKAVSGTQAGSNVSLLARELQTARQLKSMGEFSPRGFKGGLSVPMENGVRAVKQPAGALIAGGLPLLGLTTGHTAIMAPYALPAVGAIFGAYGAVKGLDRFTGYRSPAKTFADTFRDPNVAVRNPNAAAAAPQTAAAVPPGPTTGPWGPTVLNANGPWGARPTGTVPQMPMAPAPTTPVPPGFAAALNKAVNRVNRDQRQADRQSAAEERTQQIMEKFSRYRDQQTQREQAKEATDLMDARRANDKLTKATTEKEGETLADQLAQQSPFIDQSGGFKTLSKPGFGTRASKLVSAAAAVRKLQSDPEAEAADKAAAAAEKEAARTEKAAQREAKRDAAKAAKAEAAAQKVIERQKAREAKAEKPKAAANNDKPAPAKMAVNDDGLDLPAFLDRNVQKVVEAQKDRSKPKSAKPKAEPKAEAPLPQSDLWHLAPTDAAEVILQRAKDGGKQIRSETGFKAGTVRRLKSEQSIYEAIAKELPDTKTRQDFHKYLGALWGSDSPSIVRDVRDHMKAAHPKLAAVIDKHLSDERIDTLWTTKR